MSNSLEQKREKGEAGSVSDGRTPDRLCSTCKSQKQTYFCPYLYSFQKRTTLQIIICQIINGIAMTFISIENSLAAVTKRTLKHIEYTQPNKMKTPAYQQVLNGQFSSLQNIFKVKKFLGFERGEGSRRNKRQNLLTIDDFIVKLSDALKVDADVINETVDSIMTVGERIIVDFDIDNLTRRTNTDIDMVVKIMSDIFNVTEYLRVIPVQLDISVMSESVPLQNLDTMPYPVQLDAVNNPAEINLSYSESPTQTIELKTSDLIDWYLSSYFYFKKDTFDFDFGYQTYLINNPFHYEVKNPRVSLAHDITLGLDVHFAYFTSRNLESHFQFLNEHMKTIGFFHDPLFYLNHEIPFILRSQNPFTQKYVFHIIYQDYSNSGATDEYFFRSMIMLRDILLRLRFKEISVLITSCPCMLPNNGQYVKMVSYIFQQTDIRVNIYDLMIKCSNLDSSTPHPSAVRYRARNSP